MNRFFAFFLLGLVFPATSRTLATISYTRLNKPVSFSITTSEFKTAYHHIKQMAPNTPPPKKFWEDYLLYRIGVEEAYNDSTFVKSPRVKTLITHPDLREGFEQLLYKLLAEHKLKARIAGLDRSTKKLSKQVMRQYYKNNPEFDIQFIVITLPVDPTPSQIHKTLTRARAIYQEVVKSPKPFPDLINIYSDDRITGRLKITRTRGTIYPTVYEQLQKMKPGQMSPPIRTPGGFHIVKLNKTLSFSEANHMLIKAGYFDKKRGEVINRYFTGLKKKYSIQVNQTELNSIQ